MRVLITFEGQVSSILEYECYVCKFHYKDGFYLSA
jgi:hypothetical protein